LDLYPHDKVNTGVFWKNDMHVKQGVMGVYDVMKKKSDSGPQAAWFGQYFMLDALTDIAICNPFNALVSGTTTDRTAEFSNKWKNMYDGIAKANHALQNIPNVEMDETLKNQCTAEVKFLRALFYFHLLDFFGGVPIYDESWILSETFDQMMEPRSSEEAVRKFILDDLNYAEANLPYEWSKADYGRATKAAAVALRGKVNLYAENWGDAKTDFEKLVTGKTTFKCDLNDDYAEMFKPKTDENAEMIFFISNMGGVGDENDGLSMAFYHGNGTTYGGGWASSTLDPNFVDKYEMKDGTTFNWDNYIPAWSTMDSKEKLDALSCELDEKKDITKYPAYKEQIIAAYADRDPRLNETCITPYSSILGWYANKPKMMEHIIAGTVAVSSANGHLGFGGDQKWYFYRKFVPEGNCDGEMTSRINTPINFPIIRYADVLLMLAECYNELDDQTNAVKYINMVRGRKSTNMPALNSGAAWLEARTKEAVHKRIVHERGVEFAGEGVRFSDLRRWKLAEEYCTGLKTSITGVKRQSAKFTNRDYLWPIPGVEIEMNPALLPNNPDW
jgi:hypothetical protein